MKKNHLLLSLICLLILSVSAQGQKHTSAGHNFYNNHQLVWKEGPASLPKGAKVAVLEGDPAKEGPFTIRLMLPANYRVSPHWHPAIEHVTVLQGAFYMGSGETFNESGATKLSVGGFAVMPIQYPHFAFTKGKTIIQLHGIGPWAINYVNAADDPRKK